MNQRVRAIIDEARKLTPEERLELFDLLEAEFSPEEGGSTLEAIEAAWLEETRRRMAEADRGDAIFVDAEEIIAQARGLIR